MRLVPLLGLAALGTATWCALQRRHNTHRTDGRLRARRDDGSRTAPHGDVALAGMQADAGLALRAPAQSSPGFGAT